MKMTVLATFAALSIAGPAVAQELPAGSVRTSAIVGGAVYQTGETVRLTPGAVQDVISSDWQEIGTITDVVMSTEGQMIGITASVDGGTAYLPVESANLVAQEGQGFAFVTDVSLEELQGTAQ